MKNNTGEQIKANRIKMNLTQQQLANKIGVSNKAISKWESGDGLPDIENLKNVSRVFDVSIDELVSNTSRIKAPLELSKISLLLHIATIFLFFLNFVSFNPFTDENFIMGRISGFQFLRESFIYFQLGNIVIGVTLIFIIVNSVYHFYAFYKKDFRVLPKLLPLGSFISSLILLFALILITKVGAEDMNFSMTPVPIVLLILQAIQLYFYNKVSKQALG